MHHRGARRRHRRPRRRSSWPIIGARSSKAPSPRLAESMRRLLVSVRPFAETVKLQPLTFQAFAEVAQHMRHLAPAPDGVQYDASGRCGEAGLLVPYKAYLAIMAWRSRRGSTIRCSSSFRGPSLAHLACLTSPLWGTPGRYPCPTCASSSEQIDSHLRVVGACRRPAPRGDRAE